MGDIIFISDNLLKFPKNAHPNESIIHVSILSSEQCFAIEKGDFVVFHSQTDSDKHIFAMKKGRPFCKFFCDCPKSRI